MEQSSIDIKKKRLAKTMCDFTLDYHKSFKGRLDDGNITIKEIIDFIDLWVDTNILFHPDEPPPTSEGDQ